ncbi:hypothetical protein AAMO2058_000654600 [Amorphochlora amoebiformis]
MRLSPRGLGATVLSGLALAFSATYSCRRLPSPNLQLAAPYALTSLQVPYGVRDSGIGHGRRQFVRTRCGNKFGLRQVGSRAAHTNKIPNSSEDIPSPEKSNERKESLSVPPEVENTFWRWAETRGIKASDRLRLASYNGVVGLKVAGRGEGRNGGGGPGGLRPDEVILEVPASAIVDGGAFKKSPLGQRLEDDQIRLISPKVQIALVLLQSTGGGTCVEHADGELAPWVELVSKCKTPSPTKWTMEQIQRTQNPKLMTLMGALKAVRRSQLDRVQPLVKGIGGLNISEQAFDWAITEIDRRSVLVPSQNPGGSKATSGNLASSGLRPTHILAPVLDLMLPDPLAKCRIEVEKDNTLKVIANEHIAAGSRVHFRPPPPGVPNEVYLTSHAYIPEINTNDFVVLKGVIPEDEWRDLMIKVDQGDMESTQKFQLLKIFQDDHYSVSAFTLPPRLLMVLFYCFIYIHKIFQYYHYSVSAFTLPPRLLMVLFYCFICIYKIFQYYHYSVSAFTHPPRLLMVLFYCFINVFTRYFNIITILCPLLLTLLGF